MAEKMTHLFLFTLGPVQGFIAQARKTRDLYAGSQILSALVAEGMRTFEKEFPNGKIIFPSAAGNADEASLPNRFIAKVSTDKSELKAKGEAIQRAVEAKWEAIAEKSLQRAGIDPKSEQVKAQIKTLLDIHRVFSEIKTDYTEAYKALEALGGAVKNIRPFQQLEEAGRKCSIDGAYNALFYKKGTQPPAFMKQPQAVRGFALSEGEALSAISLTKRFYAEDKDFPSTAEVALLKDIAALSQEDALRLKCFKDLFKKEKVANACLELFVNGFKEKVNVISPEQSEDWNDQFDYQMLYEENLNNKNLPNNDQRKLLQHLHKDLKRQLKTRYYAVVMFDGDRMGQWLSGEDDLIKDRNNLETFHTALSGALAKFSQEARAYLDKSNGNGHTVYAGGDDFFGFVNIHHLFEVMRYLRQKFDDIVNTAIADFKKPEKHLTFSAGIVIAHYKTPFSEVLKKVREVEKSAKKEGGRNAFGIAVVKHSGEIQQAIYKWHTEDSPSGFSNWEALEQVYKATDKDSGDFSNTFIQNLSVEIAGLTGVDMNNLPKNVYEQQLRDAIPCEIRRLVSRSWKEGQKKDEVKIKTLSDQVIELWKHSPKDSDHRPRNFVHILHIADFLTRKITQEQ